MATDPMVFQFIGDTVTKATAKFVTPAATNLMFALQMVALTGVTLYIVLTGYAIMTGAIESPFWTFVKQCVKIMIIAAFALTVNGYVNGVMVAVDGLETGLTEAMSISGTQSGSTYQVLDQSLGKGIEIVENCFDKAGDAGWSEMGTALGWIIAGLIVAIGTLLITLIGGAMIIVAKFALAMMLAIGPLFILCLMFPITARFFDSWFSQVMNYVLTIVIMTIIMTFAMKVFDGFIQTADLSGDDGSNPMFAALQIGAVTGIMVWIIYQAGGMASGLAGGVSMSAMGIRHLMMPITGGLKGAKSVGNTLNPISNRRDMRTGMMQTGRRHSHMLAGNTLANPAYRQHLMQNMGRNWGRKQGGKVKE